MIAKLNCNLLLQAYNAVGIDYASSMIEIRNKLMIKIHELASDPTRHPGVQQAPGTQQQLQQLQVAVQQYQQELYYHAQQQHHLQEMQQLQQVAQEQKQQQLQHRTRQRGGGLGLLSTVCGVRCDTVIWTAMHHKHADKCKHDCLYHANLLVLQRTCTMVWC